MIERIAPYVIAVIGAPLLVLPSLLIPTKVDSPAEARAAAYGYPFHFVSSRIEILPGALGGASREELRTAYPSVEPFNPWENPTSGDGGRFAASSGTVAGMLVLVLFVVRSLRRRRRRGRTAPQPERAEA
jgi:hypothetical protein